jgi:hypothetical protein
MTSVTFELPDDQADALRANAAAQGLTLESWFQKVAEREAPTEQFKRAQAAAARIRAIQTRSKPDPEGLTVKDYIKQGRP